jgi:tryptophan synthase alpha subunit
MARPDASSVRQIPDTMKVVIGIYMNIIQNNGWDGFIAYCKNNNIIPDDFEAL